MAYLDICEPKPDDYAAIVELCNAADADSNDDPVTVQSLVQWCQIQRGVSVIAKSEGSIVGVLLCGKVGTRHHVQCLVLAPSHQDQNLERALLDKVLVKLSSRGAHTFQFAPTTTGSSMMQWNNARWQGQCDLRGETPVGRPKACSLA